MSEDSSDEDIKIVGEDLSSPQVVDKYKDAANIANRVLNELLVQIAPGQSVYDLCFMSDNLINQLVSSVHTRIKEKGVAFPTCISVNNCAGNFSPLSAIDTYVLQQGDVAKIDLAVHIDGYVSTVAHTTVVGTIQEAITGRVADVICAAYFAGECALRLIKPGKINTEVTNAIQRVANVFNVRPVQGVLSHELSRFVVDGKKL